VEAFAGSLGLRSRFCLDRLLRRERLPPITRLADWTCVLQLLWEAEATGSSLERLARAHGMDPPTCYRLVKRTIGVPWRIARAEGFTWALLELLVRPPRATRQSEGRGTRSRRDRRAASA